MTKPRVLVDLSFGHVSKGFSGIPQDTRLLFSNLSRSSNVETAGLLWGRGEVWNGGRLDRIEEQSVFLGPYLGGLELHHGMARRALKAISPRIFRAFDTFRSELRSNFSLSKLQKEYLYEIVWRLYFMSSVEPSRRQELSRKEFFLTDMGISRVMTSTLSDMALPVKLGTKGFDFAIFQNAQKIQVSKGTRKIIRYHDAIPVFASDTLTHEVGTRLHVRAVAATSRDSVFVCNSTSSSEEVKALSPSAETHVIPYFVPSLSKASTSAQQLLAIARTRISRATIVADRVSELERARNQLLRRWFGGDIDAPQIPPYLMTLSTIEPRKNTLGLIAAWQRLATKFPDLRLMIIGKPGWQFDTILDGMRPLVEQGRLLHLEGIAQRELQHLYSAAKCFVFPSFAEGFGLPPVEAMQCGCPVVVSDISAHRYMAEDAALYCDPYDRADIAAKIEQALTPNVAEVLIERGFKNAARFTEQAVLPMWEQLFEELRAKQGTV